MESIGYGVTDVIFRRYLYQKPQTHKQNQLDSIQVTGDTIHIDNTTGEIK